MSHCVCVCVYTDCNLAIDFSIPGLQSLCVHVVKKHPKSVEYLKVFSICVCFC